MRGWGGIGGWVRFFVACGWGLVPVAVQAHKTSDSYLRVMVGEGQVKGQWALALHDLEFAVGLDRNEDGAITWGELKSRRAEVLEYAAGRLALEADGRRLAVRFDPDPRVDQLANGGFVVLRWVAADAGPVSTLDLEYRAFFDVDRQHRGLVLVETPAGAQQAVFNPSETRLRFDCRGPRPWDEWWRFGREGVWHIWLGYDHLLFLLALLLPAVLERRDGGWVPVGGMRSALANVFKVVTAFTLAHSLTLSLAALGWVRLPTRWVETVIAASILVAALNNLRPVITHRAWGIAFAFGLIHGFGFAGVLADLGLAKSSLVRSLVGFNLGVELGQLAGVAVVLPILYRLRGRGFYPTIVLGGGSAVIGVLASVWLVERAQGG